MMLGQYLELRLTGEDTGRRRHRENGPLTQRSFGRTGQKGLFSMRNLEREASAPSQSLPGIITLILC